MKLFCWTMSIRKLTKEVWRTDCVGEEGSELWFQIEFHVLYFAQTNSVLRDLSKISLSAEYFL